MIEQVAKEIYLSQRSRLIDQGGVSAQRQWRDKNIPDVFWNHFLADAEAAIKAMRDLPPSVTTIEDCNRWKWTCCTCGGPKENWQAFVDAALEGGK